MLQVREDHRNSEDIEMYEYLIEYRGDFKGQIKKIEYAHGYIINKKFAVVYVNGDRINELVKEVPSILFVNFRNIFVLEGTCANDVSNIMPIKINPYLNLSGAGVLIGIVDTGIDYMNKEFIREDDTSRIEAIWDQTINFIGNEEKDSTMDKNEKEIFLGRVYLNEEINKAIALAKQGGNPYEIVPSKDEIGHGTQVASIVGARGYDKDVKGIASNCNFVIVKAKESDIFKRQVKENNIPYTPVYNNPALVAGLEYLKNYSISSKKPMIIICGIGSSDYDHGGRDLFSRYIDELAAIRGIVFVTGSGNEGAAAGHASGVINKEGDIITKELNVTKDMKFLPFKIWAKRPNKIALAITSPSGQNTRFIEPKFNREEEFSFVYEDTKLKVKFWVPDNITGLEIIRVEFSNIKKGIWKLRLKGAYIVDGRFDIWLPPEKTLPEGTSFLESDSSQTITGVLSKNAVVVGYYNQENDSVVFESGRGFPLDGFIKPDIAAPGVNILATSIGEKKVAVTGATAAAAIVTGVCALLVEWGIVKGNDRTMYSSKVISYLRTGAMRNEKDEYPNCSLGFGKLDLDGVFNNISGKLTDYKTRSYFIEYYINNLFIRIPREKW